MVIQWKRIDGCPSYQVSDSGSVRRIAPTRGYARNWALPYELRQHPDKDGYRVVILFEGGKRIKKRVHHLVAETFIGPRPSDRVCAHSDGNILNNAVSNLRYCTQQENIDDKQRHGTTARGERSARSVLTTEQVLRIRAKAGSLNKARGVFSGLAREYGVSGATIRAIVNRRTWCHV